MNQIGRFLFRHYYRRQSHRQQSRHRQRTVQLRNRNPTDPSRLFFHSNRRFLLPTPPFVPASIPLHHHLILCSLRWL